MAKSCECCDDLWERFSRVNDDLAGLIEQRANAPTRAEANEFHLRIQAAIAERDQVKEQLGKHRESVHGYCAI